MGATPEEAVGRVRRDVEARDRLDADDGPHRQSPGGEPRPCVALECEHVRALLAELERLRTIGSLARHLIQSADLNTTSGERAGITCDEEPFTALQSIFEAEREAARTIPGFVCAECDRPIYRGVQYAGKGGHAAHKRCRDWPKGTTFKVAGNSERSEA